MIQSGDIVTSPATATAAVAVGGGSQRTRLARLARAAAFGVPGVVATDAGPAGTCVTVAGGERVEGVSCIAVDEGGYEVSLRLICAPVALPALGDEVRRAIVRAAASDRFAVTIVNVHVAGIADGEER